MTGLRGTTRGERDEAYDTKAAEWRARLEALGEEHAPEGVASETPQ